MRKSISNSKRFNIFKRDSFTCQYCGNHPPEVILELDHIQPVAKGGSDDFENLITSCFNCNRGKAANSIETIPQSLAEKAARIAESEKQLKGYYKVFEAQRRRLEDEAWQIVAILDPEASKRGSYSRANFRSLTTFLQRLSLPETIEAAEIAADKRSAGYSRFKYFCGICWSKIKANA